MHKVNTEARGGKTAWHHADSGRSAEWDRQQETSEAECRLPRLNFLLGEEKARAVVIQQRLRVLLQQGPGPEHHSQWRSQPAGDGHEARRAPEDEGLPLQLHTDWE